MPITTLAPRRLLPRLAAALGFALITGTALASPDEAADALMQLLADQGRPVEAAPAVVAPATEAGLLRRVQDRASEMVVAAINFVGVRYRRGGTSAETGFDCSGFTRHVFEASLGLVLPRRADEQAAARNLVAVNLEDLKPGDLVFFNTLKRTFSHVGIYIGDHRFVHSPRSGQQIRTEDMRFAYWAKRFTGARRVEVDSGGGLQSPPSATAGE